MRQKQRTREFIHVSWFCIQFNISHFFCDLFGEASVPLGTQDHVGSGERAVPDVVEFGSIQIRKQSDTDSVFHIEIAAKAAGYVNGIKVKEVDPDILEEERTGREDSSFGEDEVRYVFFGDDDVFSPESVFRCLH